MTMQIVFPLLLVYYTKFPVIRESQVKIYFPQ